MLKLFFISFFLFHTINICKGSIKFNKSHSNHLETACQSINIVTEKVGYKLPNIEIGFRGYTKQLFNDTNKVKKTKLPTSKFATRTQISGIASIILFIASGLIITSFGISTIPIAAIIAVIASLFFAIYSIINSVLAHKDFKTKPKKIGSGITFLGTLLSILSLFLNFKFRIFRKY